MSTLKHAHDEAQRGKPACCRRDFDPATHPAHAAWLTSARELVAAGAAFDDITPFDGSAVAVLRTASPSRTHATGDKS